MTKNWRYDAISISRLQVCSDCHLGVENDAHYFEENLQIQSINFTPTFREFAAIYRIN